jgi:hypothetical protein
LSGVAGEDYFDIHGGHSWGLLYGVGEDRPVDSPTPTYYAMALWSHMGKHMVGLRESDNATTGVSAYATSGKNHSIQLLAINKGGSPRRLAIKLQGAHRSAHRLLVYSLSGTTHQINDRVARYNLVAMPSPERPLPGPRYVGKVSGGTVSYVIPGYSAVVLDLTGA